MHISCTSFGLITTSLSRSYGRLCLQPALSVGPSIRIPSSIPALNTGVLLHTSGSKMANKLKDVTFTNGKKMPIVGLGTWQATDAEIDASVDAALQAGYRHIDTAFVYLNEAAIGKALKRWLDSGKLKREDLFIVTKLPMCGLHADSVEKYMKKSLEALQLTYVDLYLVHYPCGLKDVEGNPWPHDEAGNLLIDPTTDHISVWKAMEAQVDAGRTRSIGLSNFNSKQIERIVKASRILPANLQVELHVYFQQKPLVEVCKKHGITVCAYAPIGSPGLPNFIEKRGGDRDSIPKLVPLTDPVVVSIAAKYKKTPAQILLRQIMQRGIVVIPKSSNPKRVNENFDVFDFELSNEDMKKMDALDKGKDGRIFVGSMLKGISVHPEYPLNEPF